MPGGHGGGGPGGLGGGGGGEGGLGGGKGRGGTGGGEGGGGEGVGGGGEGMGGGGLGETTTHVSDCMLPVALNRGAESDACLLYAVSASVAPV
jgi:hypothetical protein